MRSQLQCLQPNVSLQAKAVRKVLRAAFFGYLFVVLGWTSPASATTIVAKVEKDRIILAADTRKVVASVSGKGEPKDDFCKIVMMGKVGFAATGHVDYNRANAGDTLSDWSASGDAQSSYSSHPDDLVEMADDWGARAKQHYTTFYFSGLEPMRRVIEFAGDNNLNVLVTGLFAGWDNTGQPAVVRIDVRLDRVGLSPIALTRSIVYERDLPYTTNQHTKDLIEDNPELVSATAKKWSERAKAKKFPKSDLDWRWVEFLVQSTSAYDEGVGKDADVLEIRASGSEWLHNSACATHLKLQKPVPLH